MLGLQPRQPRQKRRLSGCHLELQVLKKIQTWSPMRVAYFTWIFRHSRPLVSSIINTLLKNNVIQTLKSEFLICSYECPIVLFIHPFRKYMSTCLANNSGRPQNRMMPILENSMSTLRQTGPLCRTTQISLRTGRETESQNSKGHF